MLTEPKFMVCLFMNPLPYPPPPAVSRISLAGRWSPQMYLNLDTDETRKRAVHADCWQDRNVQSSVQTARYQMEQSSVQTERQQAQQSSVQTERQQALQSPFDSVPRTQQRVLILFVTARVTIPRSRSVFLGAEGVFSCALFTRWRSITSFLPCGPNFKILSCSRRATLAES